MFAGAGIGMCSLQTHAHSAGHIFQSLGQRKSLFSLELAHPLQNTAQSRGLAAPYAGSVGRPEDSLTLHGTGSLELDGWHDGKWEKKEHQQLS